MRCHRAGVADWLHLAPPRRRRLPHRRAWPTTPCSRSRITRGDLALHSLSSDQLCAGRACRRWMPTMISELDLRRAAAWTRCHLEAWLSRSRHARSVARGEQHRQPGELSPAASGSAASAAAAREGRAGGADDSLRLARPPAGAVHRLLGCRPGAQPARMALHAMAGATHNFHLWYETCDRTLPVSRTGHRLLSHAVADAGG